jgi:transcriptional regulator with XRE-family HTH domain
MPNPLPSESLSAAVRAHFGLTQAELGQYLGVRREQVAFVEAGQRSFSLAAERRLRPLALLLPESRAREPAEPPVAGPVAPADGPEVAALRKRLRRCQHLMSELRWELENRETRAQALAQRQRGLAQLRAALLPEAAAEAPLPAEAERIQRWLNQLAAGTPPPAARADVPGLQVARLRGLAAEAQSLEELLAMTAKTTR